MARKSEREQQLELALAGKTEASRLVQEMIAIGLRALGTRMLTAIALVGDVSLFAWVMVAPSWERLLGAALFAVSSWTLVNFKWERKAFDEEGPVQP